MVIVLEVAGLPVAQVASGSQDNSYLVIVDRGISEAGTVGSCIYSIDLPLVRRRSPPLVGVAVKVTVVAGTNGLWHRQVMETLTVRAIYRHGYRDWR
jgi:predicted ATPase